MSKMITFFKLLTTDSSKMSVALADNITRSKISLRISDSMYLKIQYRLRMGKKLNLSNPITYSEKLQWLKLHYRNDTLTALVDKYAVRAFVANRIGDEYLIPLIGVWNSFEEIDFSKLPDSFVLKCTHDSKSVVICKNKAQFNIDEAREYLKRKLQNNFYYYGREWPYKNVIPKIIAEEYMEDDATNELRDYKFFCFDGEPRMMFVATDRQNANKETAFDFFDCDYNHLNLRQGHPNADVTPKKPNAFQEMIELSRTLSKGFPHVRVDFYEINGRVFFGEMTFFHFSGLMPFEPEDWDYRLGNWIKLPNVVINK